MTDPDLTFDAAGNAYLIVEPLSYPAGEYNTIGIYVYTSTDGGATWRKPVMLHHDPPRRQDVDRVGHERREPVFRSRVRRLGSEHAAAVRAFARPRRNVGRRRRVGVRLGRRRVAMLRAVAGNR